MPRPLSLVRLHLPDEPRPSVEYVFLGEILRMPGHCVVASHRSGRVYSGDFMEILTEVPDHELNRIWRPPERPRFEHERIGLPRPMSHVGFRFADDASPFDRMYPFTTDGAYILLGELVNLPGRCVVLNCRGHVYSGYRIDEFEEVADDEVIESDSDSKTNESLMLFDRKGRPVEFPRFPDEEMQVPLPMSIVRYEFLEYDRLCPLTAEGRYVFLGELVNVPGHTVVVDYNTGHIYTFVDIDELKEVTDAK